MRNVNNTIIDWLLSLLAPHLCCSCGAIGTVLCTDCKSYISLAKYDECLLCGGATRKRLCDTCDGLVEDITVVGLRTGPLQLLIGGLKFRYMRAAAEVCAQLLASQLHSRQISLVPIPTNPLHIRQRGYDHMNLITRALSKQTSCPIAPLLTTQATHTQHQLGRRDRYDAMRGVFNVSGTVDPEKHYVIVDDVITTGATILSAVHSLRAAGARHISVAALARQPTTS